MRPLNLDEVRRYVAENITRFHDSKLAALQNTDLPTLLKRKNPYLFRAKDLNDPEKLITSLLEASISTSEEAIFGPFLEDLAIFIATKTADARKSPATGIDFEFTHGGTIYLVSVKSGTSWGDDAQQTKQEEDFDRLVRVVKQSRHTTRVQPVLGICYGKTRTNMHVRGAMKVVGQNFWFLISEDPNLYAEIIEPLGADAGARNESFVQERERLIGHFTREFKKDFAGEDGLVDWNKLIRFNSENLDIQSTETGFHPIPKPAKKKKK